MSRRRRKSDWYESDALKVGLALVSVGVVGFIVFRATSAQAQEAPESPPGTVQPLNDYPLLAKLSAYWPATNAEELTMEGPDVDTRDKPLYSLQDYLEGKAPWVSVAADHSEFAYGEPIVIKELNEKYKREIDFRVHDALHADRVKAGKGTGTRRLDIRVSSRQEGLDDSLNTWVHYRRTKPPSGAVVGEVGRS